MCRLASFENMLAHDQPSTAMLGKLSILGQCIKICGSLHAHRNLYLIMKIVFVISLFTLMSCGAHSDKDSIVGKWKYAETAYVSGDKIRWVSEEDSKGIVFTFKKNDAFVFEGIADSSVTGIYKLIDSGKTIVSEIGNSGKSDTTKILKITSTSLSLEMSATSFLRFERLND
jgi:hypothetical protein